MSKYSRKRYSAVRFTAILLVLVTIFTACPAFPVFANSDVDYYTGPGDVLNVGYHDKYTNSSKCFQNTRFTVISEDQLNKVWQAYSGRESADWLNFPVSSNFSDGYILAILDTDNFTAAYKFLRAANFTYTNSKGKVYKCNLNVNIEYGYYSGLGRNVCVVRATTDTPELDPHHLGVNAQKYSGHSSSFEICVTYPGKPTLDKTGVISYTYYDDKTKKVETYNQYVSNFIFREVEGYDQFNPVQLVIPFFVPEFLNTPVSKCFDFLYMCNGERVTNYIYKDIDTYKTYFWF